MAMTELKGKDLGTSRVQIEQGPVRAFASAVKEPPAAFTGDGALVPPTFPFVMTYWGSLGEGGAAGLPIDELRGPGRMLLHGEQEFEFHRWPKVGDVLEGSARVVDVTTKDSASATMDFYVTETEWKHADSGEPAVTARFTLIVRTSKPKG
ncbi:MAG TPA: MaoC family dehydratase N-terminal domain-containing protein [Acidimicrobiia bacterium]|nr:MaoC family dehydratase N-terminal domain-containing protein [Acidimicrobiia bacterium]